MTTLTTNRRIALTGALLASAALALPCGSLAATPAPAPAPKPPTASQPQIRGAPRL